MATERITYAEVDWFDPGKRPAKPKVKTQEAIVYDPVVKRWRGVCPIDGCGFQAIRARREAAQWVLTMHLSYRHEIDA